MKYSGIVRRLDSLGRVVIPREYRKMHRIKESDPLEIIALENGDILIRKVDLSAELLTEGRAMVEALNAATGLSVFLSDNEKFLCGVGELRSTYEERPLAGKVQSLISQRKNYTGECADLGLESGFISMHTVFKEDVFGAIYIISAAPISENDDKILKTLARVLSENMQKY